MRYGMDMVIVWWYVAWEWKSETNKQQYNIQNKNSNLADELSKNNVQPNIYIYLA